MQPRVYSHTQPRLYHHNTIWVYGGGGNVFMFLVSFIRSNVAAIMSARRHHKKCR